MDYILYSRTKLTNKKLYLEKNDYPELENSKKYNISKLLKNVNINIPYPKTSIIVYPKFCREKRVRKTHKTLSQFEFGKEKTLFFENLTKKRKGPVYNIRTFKYIEKFVYSSLSILDSVYEIDLDLYVCAQELTKKEKFSRSTKSLFTFGIFFSESNVAELSFAWYVGTIKISDVLTVRLNPGDAFLLDAYSNGSRLCEHGLCVKFSVSVES